MSNSTHPSQGRQYASVFDLNGVPRFGQALPLALQHVVAMIVGCVTPAIIVSGVAGLNEHDQVILVQAALFASAISTLLQLFPFIRFGKFQLGSALPVIMGISFAYVPSMQAIAETADVGTILAAQLAGGFIAILVGLSIQKIRILFPPIITGTVVFTIGLSLYPTAINYMAGGTSSPDYGSWKNWLAAFFTLAVVVGLNHFAKGTLKLASILIGIITGYIFASFLGLVDLSGIQSAGYFQLPKPLHFGLNFDPSACIAIGVLFAINSIQAIGDFSATTVGSMNRQPKDKELQGGIVMYGVTNILCSLIGGISLQTILPLLRSYGDISNVTLSPGKILIKFIRSFPLICASTIWPFSSSTLNIAFGSFSTTTPSISITSVFDILNPPARLALYYSHSCPNENICL